MAGFRVVCPKDPEHRRFEVSAHVVELWEVDERGDFVEVLTTLDTTHPPDSRSSYFCVVCGSEAKVERVSR